MRIISSMMKLTVMNIPIIDNDEGLSYWFFAFNAGSRNAKFTLLKSMPIPFALKKGLNFRIIGLPTKVHKWSSTVFVSVWIP